MSQVLNIHAENPQLRLVRQAVEIIKAGGVMIYPTDSAYALGCRIGNKAALQKISQIRQFDSRHNFTLVCRDLSEIALYAKVDNSAYRLLKAYTPGAYTFILRATSEVPRLLMHPKRKTIGIRIPNHPVVDALLSELDEPILSSTLIMPGEENPPHEIDDIKGDLGHAVDLIIDSGFCGLEATTVVDLVEGSPRLLRAGKADTAPFQN
ncbi:MAG: threonylcarbamoyl-AMP synthase [SAR86 cluster bacterium]|uniref:Threonylcarbamoyl-AMP synthase n=1 Tax=SAR86 cluster bacterium TaxID=2030880 RepID=A0A2A5CC72_9GAMM|nr:threonylcarbamoyl-AMP synthase [Gammaproteobacteria bacterium AH-315-E17]PCJ41429.1 MAG: threonylcarbamoyl-AMP synthase [SAR86 cluster bacterium]